MRAIREGGGVSGISAAAVAAVAAGADLLCFGRDTGEQTYLAVRAALWTRSAPADCRPAGSKMPQPGSAACAGG